MDEQRWVDEVEEKEDRRQETLADPQVPAGSPDPAEPAVEDAPASPAEPEPSDEAGTPAPAEPADAIEAGQEPAADQGVRPAVDETALKAVIEAIVYVAEEPVTAAQVANSVGHAEELVKRLLDELAASFADASHGIMIREVAGGYKMATKPEHHEAVRAFAKSLKPPLKLSLAALETLATIAYKQPITAPEIMEIRGVQGAGVLKTLLDRKLIQASGRKNVIGRPILYRTTKEFLVQFGLKDLTELPTLKEFEELRRMATGEDDAAVEGAAAAAGAQPAAEPVAGTPPDSETAQPAAAPQATGDTQAEAEPAAEPQAAGETQAEAEPAAEPQAAGDTQAEAEPAAEPPATPDENA
ncbi:MAG: SMC-Scp complex subunit ScpB [Acidobacteriota bacterium]